MAQKYRALLDSTILLSKTLRDWVFKTALCSEALAQQENGEYLICELRVSQGILDEWGNHQRNKYPTVHDSVLETIRQQIIRVCGGVEEIIHGFPIEIIPDYPDEEDLHVHAAAVAGNVKVLITNDKKLIDFSRSPQGASLAYETMTADKFLMELVDFLPDALWGELYLSELDYQREKYGVEVDISAALRNAGAPLFAGFLVQEIINHPKIRRQSEWLVKNIGRDNAGAIFSNGSDFSAPV